MKQHCLLILTEFNTRIFKKGIQLNKIIHTGDGDGVFVANVGIKLYHTAQRLKKRIKF